MVRFVDVGNLTRWLAHVGVQTAITGLVERLESDFRRWPAFEKTPRLASHSPLGVIELMPTSDGVTYAFKFVNGHPANPAAGLQTVTAFGVLADVATGYPTFLAEMTLLTALRTAATSAMATRALARPDSGTAALIGTGAQSEFQALALHATVGVDRFRIWDTDPGALEKFVRNVAPYDVEVVVATSAADAVDGADIITTCTADKARAIVLPDAAVGAGVHVNALGGDCPGKTELDAATLQRAGVFVELAEQTRIEGELQLLGADFPVTELWEVLDGRAPGRRSAEQITIFDSVGFAVEDFSALCHLRDAVDGTPFFDHVFLVAAPSDPKDLFGLIAARPSLTRAGG